MVAIKTVYESSSVKGTAHVSCIKYKNLNNISHYHSDHELIYVNEGTAFVTVNEVPICLHSRECAFIHSGDIHYIQSDTDTVTSVIKADGEFFGNLFISKRLCSPLISSDCGIEAALDEIHGELTLGGEYSDTIIDSIATKLFARILRNEPTQRHDGCVTYKTNEIYSKINQKIFSEYPTLTFDEAAKYMHFSCPYFSKIFHSIFGMTFTQYLNTVRVSFAIEKLREGNMSVTEISAFCGFNTIRNFNRVFKELTGYSPNALPSSYVFIYNLRDGSGLDPTLNCTEVLK